MTVYADDSSLSVTHRLPTYTADAFRRNDWKCKCQSSAECFSAHRLKAHRESESPRDVNWLKKSEGGLPGVCHAHFENLRTGVKARTPPPVACREGVYSGAAGRNSLSLNDHDSSLALITDSAGAQPTAPTQSCPSLMTGIIIFPKHHQFLPLPFPTGKDA